MPRSEFSSRIFTGRTVIHVDRVELQYPVRRKRVLEAVSRFWPKHVLLD